MTRLFWYGQGRILIEDYKAMEGSFQEADMHLRGLKRLVGSRGGPMVFKDTYHVAQAICW